MEKVIAVVSGKGGVGKTTFVSNIGLALTEMQKDVVVVDTDLTTSNLGLQLGFYQFPLGLQDVLDGNIGIANAIYTHPSGLKVVPASISLNFLNKVPNPYRLKSVLNDLRGLILIDSPPGLRDDALLVLRSADDVIVITNPEIPAVTDALKVIRVSRELGKEPLGIVLNRVKDSFELKQDEIESMCDCPVIGKIPEDVQVKKSLFEKTPVVAYRPYSPASIAFRKIAASLIGQEYTPPSFLFLRRIFGK
ncbi:MAG TPA: septum site-determining protein MinD [Candidatus Aenigmarchaeota archaeon]|nr:septum site-determining protein MinD [Candidatus Aenigmarchaeota archaeon]